MDGAAEAAEAGWPLTLGAPDIVVLGSYETESVLYLLRSDGATGADDWKYADPLDVVGTPFETALTED